MNRPRRLAIIQERDRIGRAQHDGIIQTLYGVGLGPLEDVPELMTDRPGEADGRVDLGESTSIHAVWIRELRSFDLRAANRWPLTASSLVRASSP